MTEAEQISALEKRLAEVEAKQVASPGFWAGWDAFVARNPKVVAVATNVATALGVWLVTYLSVPATRVVPGPERVIVVDAPPAKEEPKPKVKPKDELPPPPAFDDASTVFELLGEIDYTPILERIARAVEAMAKIQPPTPLPPPVVDDAAIVKMQKDVTELSARVKALEGPKPPPRTGAKVTASPQTAPLGKEFWFTSSGVLPGDWIGLYDDNLKLLDWRIVAYDGSASLLNPPSPGTFVAILHDKAGARLSTASITVFKAEPIPTKAVSLTFVVVAPNAKTSLVTEDAAFRALLKANGVGVYGITSKLQLDAAPKFVGIVSPAIVLQDASNAVIASEPITDIVAARAFVSRHMGK